MIDKTICPGCGEIPNEPKGEEKAYVENAEEKCQHKGVPVGMRYMGSCKNCGLSELQIATRRITELEALEAGMRGERNMYKSRAEKAEVGRDELAKVLKTIAMGSTRAADQEARLADDRKWREKVKYQKTRAEKAEANWGRC